MQSPKGLQESAQDLKFGKLTTNIAAQGLLHKTVFLSSLVSLVGVLPIMVYTGRLRPKGVPFSG